MIHFTAGLVFCLALKRSPNIIRTITSQDLCMRTIQWTDPRATCALRTTPRARENGSSGTWSNKIWNGNCWAATIAFFSHPPLAVVTASYTHPSPTRWLQKYPLSLLCHLLENRWIFASCHLQVSCGGITGPQSSVRPGLHGGPTTFKTQSASRVAPNHSDTQRLPIFLRQIIPQVHQRFLIGL